MESIFSWDRTVLEPTSVVDVGISTPPQRPGQDTTPDHLGTTAIWNYLIYLSQSVPNAANIGPGEVLLGIADPLLHYTASDFKQGWESAPEKLGAGASYTVEKWTLHKDIPSRSSKNSAVKDQPSEVVAIKRLNIPRGMLAPAGLVDTVLKELRILTHPPLRAHRNIARLLGFRSDFPDAAGTAGSSALSISLVAEFATFGTLQEFLLSGQREAAGEGDKNESLLGEARLMYDVASGMEFLHGCCIAHGDVKTENILVYRGNQRRPHIAKISDFGHSILDLDKPGVAASQRYLGTRLLNAPEVRFAGRARFTCADDFYRCDVFSYGLLAWEVLLGGNRFYTALGPDITKRMAENESEDQRVMQLAALPKDELLVAAKASLRARQQRGDSRAFNQMLDSVLDAVLRDNAHERKTAGEVLQLFRRQKIFQDDENLRIFIEERSDIRPLSPMPANSMQDLPKLPESVQKDLVEQWQTSLGTAKLPNQRRTILFDLALCALAGVGIEVDNESKALAWLAEAAQLGSTPALAIVFRLHSAFQVALPPSLLSVDSPYRAVEDALAALPVRESHSPYFSERVRQFERLIQEDCMHRACDITIGGKAIASNITLDRATDLSSNLKGVEVGDLKCTAHESSDDEPTSALTGTLILVAARLGLMPLLRLLLSVSPAAAAGEHTLDKLSGDMLCDILRAACRGGHLDILEFLLVPGPGLLAMRGRMPEESMSSWADGTALHWLIMFPEHQMERAMELLLGRLGAKAWLQTSVPAPGIPLPDHRVWLRGTPLEFAILVNNAPLIELFLRQVNNLAGDLTAIGWTAETLCLAANAHLSGLLPRLMAIDEAYCLSTVGSAAVTKLWGAQGVPHTRKTSLFLVARASTEPVRLLLIHGPKARAELDATLLTLVGGRLSSINDEDERGSTALTYAIRSAPCHPDTDVLSVFLEHCADFGQKETPKLIVLNVLSKRRASEAKKMTELLLEYNLLPHALAFLTVAVASGNSGIVEAMLDFSGRGTVLDAAALHVDEETNEPASLLFFGLTTPGCAATLRVLLDRGADPASLLPGDGRTPLEVLIGLPECDGEAIDLLIECGAPLVLRDGMTILHRAALTGGHVRRVHVLVHLLRHDRIRALVNHPGPVELADPRAILTNLGHEGLQLMPPLTMACLAAKAGAVEAILQAGADVRFEASIEHGGKVSSSYPLPQALATARRVGRHPRTSPLFDQTLAEDETAICRWRRDVEKVMMTLLNWADPGHGRTALHIAAELANYPRLVELVDHWGLKVFVADRHNRTPLAYLQDMSMPDKDLDELRDDLAEQYVGNLGRVRQYLMAQLVEELCSDMDSAETIRDYLAMAPGPGELEDDTNKAARAEIEGQLRQLERDRDEITLNDGYYSPAELVHKFSGILTAQREKLGGTDRAVLGTMRRLASSHHRLGQLDRAHDLQVQVLAAMKDPQTQVPHDAPEYFRACGEHAATMCLQGHVQAALDFVGPVSLQAFDILGNRNLVSLELADMCHGILALLGRHQFAAQQQELALEIYQSMASDMSAEDAPDLTADIAILKASLAISYYKLDQPEQAQTVIGSPGAAGLALESVRSKHFFNVFDALLHTASYVENVPGQAALAEQMYCEVVEACLQRHRKRKSHSVRVALERLAAFYHKVRKYKEQAATLQKLADRLTSTLGLGHPDAIRARGNLALCILSQQMWDEFVPLQEQVVQSLETLVPRDEEWLLRAKQRLAFGLNRRGDLEQAERMSREAAAGFRLFLGEEAEATVDAEATLAVQLSARGGVVLLAEAVTIQRRVISWTVQRYGEESKKTRSCLDSLVGMLLQQKELKEAEREARRCLAIHETMADGDDAVLARVTSRLAMALEREDRTHRSEQLDLFRRSMSLEMAANGGKHNERSLRTLKHIANSYIDSGDLEEAAPLLREIIDAAPSASAFYQDLQPAVDACRSLGMMAHDLGNMEDAIEHYEAAAALSRRIHGDSAPETARLLNILVRIYSETEEKTSVCHCRDAYEAALDVLRVRRDRHGEFAEETRDIKVAITGLCGHLDMWPEAERIDRDLLRQYQHVVPGEEETAARYMTSVAISCLRQGGIRRQEAESFARRALEYWSVKGDLKEAAECSVRLAEALAGAGGELPEVLHEAEQLCQKGCEMASLLRERDGNDASADEVTAQAHAVLAIAYLRQRRWTEAERLQLELRDARVGMEGEMFGEEDVKQMRALSAIYAAQGRYEEAVALGREMLDLAKAYWYSGDEDDGETSQTGDLEASQADGKVGQDEEADAYLEDNQLMWWVLVDLTELLGPRLGRWQEARQAGNLAVKWIVRSTEPASFESDRLRLAALKAVKPVREELGLQRSLRETESAIAQLETKEADRLRIHLATIEEDEVKFRAYLAFSKHPAQSAGLV